MSARILKLICSCAECPNRHYYTAGIYECIETGRELKPGAAQAVVPDWCPLPIYPAHDEKGAGHAAG